MKNSNHKNHLDSNKDQSGADTHHMNHNHNDNNKVHTNSDSQMMQQNHSSNDNHHVHKNMNHNHSENHHNSNEHMNHGNHHTHMVRDFKRRFIISLLITIPILVLSPMIQNFLNIDLRFKGDLYISLALSTILLIYGGKPFFKGSIDEVKAKTPAMMMLITFAISVAYIYSTLTVFGLSGNDFFWELSTLIVIMLLGHWLEMKSAMGASKALESLVNLMPKIAHVIKDNGEVVDISINDLKVNDRLLVKPGENIPIDGQVYEGNSAVNESIVTGESSPVDKAPGDTIIGGSTNGEGILKFTVSKIGDETFLSQVIKLVKDAQSSKSKTQRLADTAAKWLFYVAMIAGVITFISWMLKGESAAFALERTVTVIIISCPHALGVAVPLVTSVSTSIAAKRGLLIRNRVAFESARKLNAVVFDKTGTLTLGSFGITNIKTVNTTEEDLLSIAYSLESNSEHPIAKGIVADAKKANAKLLKVEDYRTLPGVGLIGFINNDEIMIVSPGYMKENNIKFDISDYNKYASEGKTVVFILKNKNLIGYIGLSDIVRESAIDAVKDLKEMKITSVMLTGDNKLVANQVGKNLNISKVISEVLPNEKVTEIKNLQESGLTVAMTGDGVNDAPSLAKADLGIAIGAGTDVAIETADVILVRSDPKDVVNLIKLSKATYRKMIQNLIWATSYNIIALPLAAGIFYYQGIVVSPALGAILMSLSAIIVSINAKLLKLK